MEHLPSTTGVEPTPNTLYSVPVSRVVVGAGFADVQPQPVSFAWSGPTPTLHFGDVYSREQERGGPSTLQLFSAIARSDIADTFNTEVLRPEIRSDVCFVFQHYFRKRFSQNQDFLKEQQINRHGVDHQRHVVSIANRIGRAFRPEDADENDALSDERMTAALLFGLIHDAGYEPSAHPKANGEPTVTKKTLDYHPVRGARIAQYLLDYFEMDEQLRAMDFCPLPELAEIPPPEVIERARKITKDWTPEQKRIAIEAILFHSNGSEYDGDVALAAKLIRLADKLDMHNRVMLEHITPDVRERDPMYFHRLVPASIKDMRIEVNHATKQFVVSYHAEIDDLAHDLNGGYTNEQFVDDFRSAYDKSMQIAAEVVQSLWEYTDGQALSSDKPCLQVNLVLWQKDEKGVYAYRPIPLHYAPFPHGKKKEQEAAA